MVVITETEELVEEIAVLDEVDELLLDAEQYIREHGWTTGKLINWEGGVCVSGSVC